MNKVKALNWYQGLYWMDISVDFSLAVVTVLQHCT